MQQWIRIIRAQDWWYYKIPPILAVAYGTLLLCPAEWSAATGWLLLRLLFTVIAGAVFVSIINDYTDIEEDLNAGKPNRLADRLPASRRLIMAGSTLLVLCIAFSFLPDWNSAIAFCSGIGCFILYSCPPFRFKHYPVPGPLMDASGSQLFPSLLMITAVSFQTRQELSALWSVSTGVWALAFGLRGILWHQIHDRENDLRIGIRTFATTRSSRQIGIAAILIFSIELASLAVMMWLLQPILLLLAFAFYGLVARRRAKTKGIAIVLVKSGAPGTYQLACHEFYQIYLPLTLLLLLALKMPGAWLLLPLHLLLFFKKIRMLCKELFWMALELLRK